jgi:pseudouridine synthase
MAGDVLLRHVVLDGSGITVRLNRFLAMSAVASRRKCEAIIAAGRVRVNGQTVDTPAVIVDPGRDTVELDGRRIRPASIRGAYLLHKPHGVLTTLEDPGGRPTVSDYLPPGAGRVYPAGRLDRDSTGLILLTDDGALAFRVTHPKYRLPKYYLVRVKGRVRDATCRRWEEGVELDDGPARALAVRVVATDGTTSVIRFELGAGRKRQIRRMAATLGHTVLDLHRDGIGPIRLGDLDVGESRPLEVLEIRSLRRALGLADG